MSDDASELGGFDGYEVTTMDPGVSVLIGTLLFCALLLLMLPFVVRLEDSCLSTKTTSEHRDETSSTSGQDSNDRDENSNPQVRNASIKAQCNQASHPGPRRQNISCNDGTRGWPGSGTSTFSQLIDTILEGAPYRGPTPSRNRAAMERHDRYVLENPMLEDIQQVRFASTTNAAVSSCRRAVDENTSLDYAGDSQRGSVESTSSAFIWVGKGCSIQNFQCLLAIADIDYETKRICKLTLPFAAQSFVVGLTEILRVALIGKHIGTKDLAAYVTVEMLVALSSSYLGGIPDSVSSLASRAVECGNKRLAGQYVQISMILLMIAYIPVLFFWAICTKNVLQWFGYDHETAAIGSDFALVFVVSRAVQCVERSLHALMDVVGLERYSSRFVGFREVVATGLVVFVALQPKPTLQQVGNMYLLASVGALYLDVAVILATGLFRDYLGGLFGSLSLLNIQALRLVIATSASLSIAYFFTFSEWEILAITTRFLGPAEVTAWAVLGTLWDAVQLMAEALANAAEIRTAFWLTAGQPQRARRTALKAMYLVCFMSLFVSSFLFIVGDDLSTWITNDATLQRLIAELVPLFGIGNVVLAVGTMSWTLVGAQGRYQLSTAVNLASCWLISIPLACISSIVLNLDLQGQTAAVIVGYMVSGTLNSYFLLRSDWEQMSKEAVIGSRSVTCDQDTERASGPSDNRIIPSSPQCATDRGGL